MPLTRRLTRAPVLISSVALALLMITCAQAYLLWRSYYDTWNHATQSAENVLNSIASNIERNLSIVELSVSGLRDAAEQPEIQLLPPSVRNHVLFDRAAGAQFLGSMLVLDKDGTIISDSGAVPPRSGNFADRDYFIAQLEGDTGSFLSAPYKSRLRNGDQSIVISQRISDQTGAFNGIAMAAIRIKFFKSLFSRVNLSPNSIITLTRTDGTLLLRDPSTDGAGNTGASLVNSPIFRQIMANPGSWFTNRSTFDHAERFYIHTRIKGFPLLLTIGLSTVDVMRDWYRQAMAATLITFVFCLIVILVVRALRIALRRSEAVEAELAALSLTDTVTGLPNRRAFDLAVSTEARRTAREGMPLAIALVDIDHFKQVNDLYGHPTGDVVLQRLGATILRSIRRPGDFAARFGGEEFVMILPSTDLAGARFICERVRANVEALTPAPDQPALKSVTVSIGVAAASLKPGDTPAALIRQADEALYAAKGGGRNMVVSIEKKQTEPAPAD